MKWLCLHYCFCNKKINLKKKKIPWPPLWSGGEHICGLRLLLCPGHCGFAFCLLIVTVTYWVLPVCQAFVIPPLILKKIWHSVVYEIAIFEGQKMVKCWQFHMVPPNIMALLFKYYCPQFQIGSEKLSKWSKITKVTGLIRAWASIQTQVSLVPELRILRTALCRFSSLALSSWFS